MQNVQLDVLKHPAKFHFILWYSPGDMHRLLYPLDGVFGGLWAARRVNFCPRTLDLSPGL